MFHIRLLGRGGRIIETDDHKICRHIWCHHRGKYGGLESPEEALNLVGLWVFKRHVREEVTELSENE